MGGIRTFSPLLLIFLIVGGSVLLANDWLTAKGLNTQLLQGGNLFLFLVFVISTWLQQKGMQDASTQIFLRNVYGGIMLKLFGCAIAAFIYIYLSRDTVNKPALFGCMLLYFVYTSVELRIVLKKNKRV